MYVLVMLCNGNVSWRCGLCTQQHHHAWQVWRCNTPVQVPNEEALWGCFSWVDVPAAPGWDVPGSFALGDGAFAEQQQALRQALQLVDVEQLAVEGL